MRPAFTLITLVLLTAQSKADTTNLLTFGIGQSSCAKWLSTPALEIEGNDWILGFWTGVNVGTFFAGGGRGNIGHSTDAFGIIGEVKKLCLNSPSQLVSTTASVVFHEFVKAGK